MTQLIDADKLKEHIDKLPALPDGNFAGTHRNLKALINMQPTVDAIPIEWIENYLRNYRYMAPIEKNFVREMIKVWEVRKEE
jgi:DNA-binding SARP family transcriptional activator